MKLLPIALAALATVASTSHALPGYDEVPFHFSRDTNAVAGPSVPRSSASSQLASSPSTGSFVQGSRWADSSQVSAVPGRRRRSDSTGGLTSIAGSPQGSLASTLWDFLGGRKRRAVRAGQPRVERRLSRQPGTFSMVDVEGQGSGKGKAREVIAPNSRKRKRSGTCKSPNKANASSPTAATSASVTSAPSRIQDTPKPTATGSAAVVNGTTDGDRTVNTGKVMAGYWPDWSSSSLPPEKIDFSKFDFINYAFALPTQNFDLNFPTDNTKGLLKRLATAAHAANSKVVLSIGGWGGSTYFSPAVATSSARSTFIGNIKKVYNQYQLDGIDLDWEYPGQGNEGNQYTPQDTANFQTFLQELRAALPKEALISAAVAHQPWVASTGQPVTSVARAASALDFILIMNYDVWGSSDTPGPNAPLANLCGTSSQPRANAAAGVKQWAAAGMPREKILLGIPSYGYLNGSSKRKLRARSDNSLRAKTLAVRDASASRDETTPAGYTASRPEPVEEAYELQEVISDVPSGKVGRYDARRLPSHSQPPPAALIATSSSLSKRALTSSDGSSSSGQINFKELVKQGALKKDASTGLFVASGGFQKYWDDCSDTPYLANGQTVVTYDDTSSLWDKGAFAVQAGIGGVNIWSIDGDTPGWDLVNSAIAGMTQGGTGQKQAKV